MNFRYLVAARVITTLGNSIAPIALAFAVLDLTGSMGALGLVVGVRTLTHVALLLVGGVVADRFPRQFVLVGSGCLAAVTQAAVAALVLSGAASVPMLVALSAVNGAAAAFGLPASQALLPQTVTPDRLVQANAINRFSTSTAMIIGAAAGGILVAAVGPGWGLAVDAVTFAAGAAIFSRIRVSAPAHRGETSSPWRDLREGWAEVRSRTWIWVVVIGFCFFNVAEVGAINIIGPAVADATVGRATWGLVLAADTAGMLVGAVVAARLRLRRPLLVGTACCLGGALFPIALALAPSVPALLVAGFLTGFAVEQFAIAWDVSLQRNVPADRLARVYSFDSVGSFVAIPLGQVAAGPIGEAVGTTAALLGAAAIIVVAVALMLASRSVRTLEAPIDQRLATMAA